MAPSIHPPCTPTASCTPQRCHPTPPPCASPEKCLETSAKKGSKPCPSAVSIMATKSKTKCTECSKCGGRKGGDLKSQRSALNKYLAGKNKEAKLLKKDRRTGGHSYEDYMKKKNRPRSPSKNPPCCQGRGHRGTVKGEKKKCTIL